MKVIKRLPKTLTINRAKWLPGQIARKGGVGGSALLDPQSGRMCCLGFCMLRVGAKKADILNKGLPSDVFGFRVKPLETRKEPMLDTYTVRLSTSNDTMDITARRRETQITNTFAELGCKVRFTGRLGRGKVKGWTPPKEPHP